jgi:hypothetical protein
VNEAALLAGRKNKVVVEKIDFIEAVERSIAVSKFVLDNIDFIRNLSWWMHSCNLCIQFVQIFLSNHNVKVEILFL